jgi:hypothetical protein
VASGVDADDIRTETVQTQTKCDRDKHGNEHNTTGTFIETICRYRIAEGDVCGSYDRGQLVMQEHTRTLM